MKTENGTGSLTFLKGIADACEVFWTDPLISSAGNRYLSREIRCHWTSGPYPDFGPYPSSSVRIVLSPSMTPYQSDCPWEYRPLSSLGLGQTLASVLTL